MSVLLLEATLTATHQVVADVWHCKDTCTRLHRQPHWLLQQLAVRCQWRRAEEATSRSWRSCCSGGDGSTKVRPHHAGASWTSLASSLSENRVYKLAITVYQCLHGMTPTYLANDCVTISAIAGKRHLRFSQYTTNNKDHAGDEEFCDRRSIHLEQFTSRPTNRNSLPIDFCSTSEGPLVRLHDRQRGWGPFMTRFTNLLIIIIIIIISDWYGGCHTCHAASGATAWESPIPKERWNWIKWWIVLTIMPTTI